MPIYKSCGLIYATLYTNWSITVYGTLSISVEIVEDLKWDFHQNTSLDDPSTKFGTHILLDSLFQKTTISTLKYKYLAPEM